MRKILLLTLILLATGWCAQPVFAATTTELHIVKYANDGTSILNETTVSSVWMEDNLPVYGDGTTHYYHQGLNYTDGWNMNEDDPAILTKDMGAVKGSNLADLCDLVGGMSPGDKNVTLLAADGFNKRFNYSSVYAPPSRAGPIVITWYKDGLYVNGSPGSNYTTGMRNVMFADTSVNPWGYHVFGVYDMHEAYDPDYWYFYGGDPNTPTTTGLSVQNINRVYIYSNEAPPAPTPPEAAFSAAPLAGNAPLAVQFTDESTGTAPLTYAWDFNDDLTIDNTTENPLYTYPAAGTYTVNLTVTNAAGSDSEVKTGYITVTPAADTVFDGEITLTESETFNVTAYNSGSEYTVNRTTPLGALDAVAHQQGFTYNVTDSRWAYDEVLLLDDIAQYLRKSPNYWYAYVNGVYKDGYQNHPDGLNVIELADDDQVSFYYAPKSDPNPVVNATAVVKILVNTTAEAPPSEWSLSLAGAQNKTISQTYFEQGLACPSSGHEVFWTDTEGDVWGGVPLWLLVAMVDDYPDIGPDHFNFNDSIAAQGYSVKVISGDGWDTTLASADIARNNSFIVANTLNGAPLPLNTTSDKLSWPLHLKGEGVFGGQQVGNITSIELTGLPEPSAGWELMLQGDVTDVITQSYFEEAIACHHNVTWTDGSGNIWTGVPLWDLAGAVDDIETSSHFTFNDTRAAANYTIRVVAVDDFNATFYSTIAAHNDGYIVANMMNGVPLTGTSAPLKLVGPSTTSGKERVGNITRISLEGLPDQFPAGDWQLNLNGTISDVIPQPEFEYWAVHHGATYTDPDGLVYTGVPLWRLMGWVDDRIPHGPDGFNDAAATAGYTVIVKAGDGYAKEFTSQQIGKNESFIVANTLNGSALPTTGSHPPYPLRLVGPGATGGNSVGNIVEIQLTDFQTPVEIPELHIIKYDSDGVTVLNETTVSYPWMESNLPVIGDGVTVYRFEGLTMNPSNLWDPEETYPGGYKIANAVKGTRVHDLVELVGGMGSGTTATFVASDGFETTLPYSSIYTNPAVQARQGDAIIAWYADGNYVPDYGDGMRLFFTPDGDHVYGHWDMHETLPDAFWRYNYQDGVMYPSAAGLSAKYVTTIKVYSVPESDWTLELDGRDIGGINYTVSKPYFEEAVACQMGADHKATYTDSKDREWEGIALWFLAGFVDDADQHSASSFNDTLASNGYRVVVRSTDGSSATIDSRLMMRNSNYIVANSLNGSHIPDTDENWPLRLTGANVSGSSSIKNISSISLLRYNASAEIGVFMDGTWALDKDGSYSWNAGDHLYTLGATGAGPVYGDWNGDGMTEIGITDGGSWYLDYNGNGIFEGSVIDRAFSFGSIGANPVVGDWNGNGKDEIGIELNGGLWSIDYNGNYAWDGPAIDRFASLGQNNDIPVIGDWNGDGKDEIGSHKDGFWIIDYNGNYAWDGVTDDRFAGLGQANDKPVIGDWNGDGKDEIGMETEGFWAVDYSGNYQWDGVVDDRFAGFGQSGDTPVVADWNGDGRDEICSFTDGFWAVDLNGNYVWDGIVDDRFAGFGGAGALPVVGNWV